jgi:hypothetical protein
MGILGRKAIVLFDLAVGRGGKILEIKGLRQNASYQRDSL